VLLKVCSFHVVMPNQVSKGFNIFNGIVGRIYVNIFLLNLLVCKMLIWKHFL